MQGFDTRWGRAFHFVGGSAVSAAWYLPFELAMANMFLRSQNTVVCLLPKTKAFLVIAAVKTV